MINIAIVAIVKDDNVYLDEWIKYHIGIGVDEILIYDNNSKIPLSDEVKKLPEEYQSKVIVELFPEKILSQQVAYESGRKYYMNKARFVSFIDIDEGVVCEQPLQDLVNFYGSNPTIGCVLLQWKIFNASGQKFYENKPVIERFTETVDDPTLDYGKTLCRPEALQCIGVHFHNVWPGYYIIHTDLGVHDYKENKQSRSCYDRIYVAHYFTKSYEEWLWKLNRGTCDERYVRKYKEFFEYNPDMQDCYEEKYEKLVEGGLD